MTHSPPTNTSGSEDRGRLSVADILDRAADLIEPEGAWTQGAYGRNQCGETVLNYSPDCVCRCASGALWSASGESADNRPGPIIHLAHVAVARQLRASLGHPVSISVWNDRDERTQAEVVAALRQAAAAERARATGSPS